MSETTMPESPLPGKTLRELRARAHALKPVVWISENGATPPVLREIDRALNSHELIKIHAAVDGRSAREALLDDVCANLGAQPVQVIGKMLVAYRPNPKPAPPKPVPAEARRPAAKRSAAEALAKSPAKAARKTAKFPARKRPSTRAWPTASRKSAKAPPRRTK